MNPEAVDPFIAQELRAAHHWPPRVPRETFTERHAALVLGLWLLAFWVGTVIAFAWIFRR